MPAGLMTKSQMLTKRQIARIEKRLITYDTASTNIPLRKSPNKKDLQPFTSVNPLSLMVRPARFELATYGFVVRRSVRAELRAHENLIEICTINKL